MTDFDKKAQDILGSCTCHEAYRGRGLTAPDCVWCEHGADTAAALKAAYNDGVEAALKAAYNEGLEDALKEAQPWFKPEAGNHPDIMIRAKKVPT